MENTNTNISHNGEDLLVVKDLCKTFKNGKKTVYALDHVSNVIKKNEKVVIIGPSGSGKSTFLRCLNCMEDPTGGSIFFEGEDLADMKVDINKHREHIGMVFQQFNLFNNKTVLQNIMLAPVYIRTKKAGGLFAPRSVKKQIKAEAEAARAACKDRSRGQGERLPLNSLGRTEAAYSHNPRACHEPQGDAF